MTTVRLELWDTWTDRCPDCAGRRTGWTGEAVRDGGRVAMVWWFAYDHADRDLEVFVDAALGGWGDPAAPQRVTFGSRTGAVDGARRPASSLVTGGAVAPDEPVFGRKLSRDDALGHPLLPIFWTVSDLALEHVAASSGQGVADVPVRRRWRRRARGE